MDDRMVVNTGMTYAQKTMEAGNDVVQALLAALSGKSIPQQRQVLDQFAKYVQTGGKLEAVPFDLEHLADFDQEAREIGLAYYAIRNRQTNQVTVMIRDCDMVQLNQVAEHLARRGTSLYPDPQLSVSDFLEKNEGKEIQFSPVESMEKLNAAKWEAAKGKKEFAIGKQQDGRYIVIFRGKDAEALKEAGIIYGKQPVSGLFQVSDIEEVRKVIREERQAKEAAGENEKQHQKNHGR